MKLTIRLFILIALLLGMFGQYTAVSAADVFMFNGLTANAFFNDWDGCVQTSFFLGGIDRLDKTPPGPGEAASTGYLSIYQVDWCSTEGEYIYGQFPIDEDGFVVDKKLGWASLDTTVTVWDVYTQSNIEVDLNLTWTATGPLVPTKTKITDNTPHCHWIVNGKRLQREADLSGTITYGDTTWTPDTSWNASISSFKTGQLTVGCE